ncbi:Tat (twin-arginine translocation) pathway signal sequence [Denitrobacterium detoxificans]|uniref:Tat (Twin-arginine translocation) pathway signal sequence n=2 Tax=Denitrobacterium detoxificans TaxID=79604 RepID=A0A1H8TGZ4_9ACTN|nr:Tat (twin-arginine translocation) pathway signal sequence [Denitrobacterium detoxificans]
MDRRPGQRRPANRPSAQSRRKGTTGYARPSTRTRGTRVRNTTPPSASVRGMGSHRSARGTGRPRASKANHAGASGTLLTRRHFLYGAIGVGAVAAVGFGANTLIQQRNAASSTISTLSVPASNVSTLDDYAEIELNNAFEQVGEYELPYGTLMWCNDDSIATCLIPTETASPLTQIGVMKLSSGNLETVVEAANGASDGFEIYDVRGTSSGLVWTEANIFEGTWRILTATLSSSNSVGTAHVVDSGDSSTETPSIAAVDGYAYWVVMPPAGADNEKTGTAQLKRAQFGQESTQTVYEGTGRMAAPLYGASDGVVITPRHPDGTSYFQLVHVNGSTGEVDDSITLPSAMQPVEVGYGNDRFSFCFEAIYSYGDGIANLGTYTPATNPNGNYDSASWFRFGRTPLAPPAWCGDWLIVKSSQSVVAINFASKSYCTFGIISGATSWGDYLAVSGTHDRVVTISQINEVDTESNANQTCTVRVWKPLS